MTSTPTTTTLAGYRAGALVYESRRTSVRRATRASDGVPVILKILQTDEATAAEVAKLHHEFELLESLESPHVGGAIEMIRVGGKPTVVLEDNGGRSLAERLAEGPIDLSEGLAIARGIAAGLVDVHAQGILHNDINPSNVVLTGDGRALLIDFGLSTRDRGAAGASETDGLAVGTLAYIPPESTGRLARRPDERSDLYSLGATLYELFTGRRPFSSTNPQELVHAHIARRPRAPVRVRPELPQVLSDLIMLLLEKDQDARYQTAAGVLADLDRCAEALEKSGDIGTFPLRERDRARSFNLRDRLYGRDAEIRRLAEAFERVADGPSETILVRGPSGIGKASLVRELKRVVAERRGYFIEGTFQESHSGRPHAGLADAFDGLVAQVLREPEERVEAWKRHLEEALEDEARVIVDMLPNLVHVLGDTPDVPELAASEAQARFTRRFRGFVGSITRRGAPLVVFLDNLQWADAATLDAVKERVLDASIQRVLLVATVRTGAESPRLQAFLDALDASEARPEELELGPIEVSALAALLVDAMDLPEADDPRARELAALIHERTGGSPFFVRHFAQELLRKRLIRFDAASEQWAWSVGDIAARGFTDNVIEMMAGQLADLPEATREVLSHAALVGSPFDLAVVAGSRTAAGRDDPAAVTTTLAALRPALDAGYVVPTSSKFEHADVAVARGDSAVGRSLYGELQFDFAHDRVQEAAAGLLDVDAARRAHRAIGQYLQRQAPEGAPEAIHDILRHLNAAGVDDLDEDERYDLARLNVQGARSAEATAGFQAALEYWMKAEATLPEDAWRMERRLTFSVASSLISALIVRAHYEEAAERGEALLRHARTRTEKTRVRRSLIMAYVHLRDSEGMMRTVKAALEPFDIHVPETDEEIDAEGEALARRVARWERHHAPRDLLDLEPMDDPEQRLLMQLLSDAAGATWFANAKLPPLLTALMLDISLEYGLAPETCIAVARYAETRADLDDPEQIGHAYLEVAIELADRSGSRGVLARALSLAVFASGPSLGLRERAELIRRGEQAAYESGDGYYLQMLSYLRVTAAISMGAPLSEVVAAMERTDQLGVHFGLKRAAELFAGPLQYVDALRGENLEDNLYLGPDSVRDRILGPKGERDAPGWHSLMSARVRVFCRGADREAWDSIRVAGDVFRGGSPGMIVGDQCLIEGVIGVEMVRQADTDAEREALSGHVEAALRVLRRYRDLSPQSYGMTVDLIEAEVAATRGRTVDAMELFHRAIDAAEREQRLDVLGLAQERAGQFFLALDKPRIAAPFLAAAHRTYRTWGATLAARRVDEAYGALIAPLRAQSRRTSGPATVTTTVTSSTSDAGLALDAMAVLEAAQALSSEVDLDRLLDRLMQIIVSNAGADRALLLTRADGSEGDEWLVRAERRVTDGSGTMLGESALDDFEELPRSVVDYTIRTKKVVRLDDASVAESYGQDPYIASHEPRAILCVPSLHQGDLVAVLYLENRLAAGTFTHERAESVQILATQAAISIVNAHLVRDLRAASDRLLQSNERLTEYNRALEKDVADRFAARHVVGESVAMQSMLRDAARVADSDAPVLLQGERGTGKEHIARVIHEQSGRGDGAFVKVSCRALAPDSVDPDGETRTVQRAAPESVVSRFDLAAGGTLYIEDIDKLDLAGQNALVERLAQEPTDGRGVRLIVSTGVDLATSVSMQRFSDALYFRINAFPIRVPPLRERRDDIPVLVERYLVTLSEKLGKRIDGVSEESMARLMTYPWPGNVVELSNVLERAALVAETPTLSLADAFDGGVDAGTTLGSYSLVERIGAGGMGEVWRATHKLLRRPAAIKLIPSELLTQGESEDLPRTMRRRFEREAQATAQLRSPHTVELYDFGISEAGTFYYVMELLEGVDLQTLVERFGPLDPERVVHILRQVCRSLAEAHAAGLVHRDIKPANVYLCRLGAEVDFVKVLDFGMVKHTDGAAQEAVTQLTAAGTVKGTPAYMAPEQAMESAEVTARADIYALGCIAFWLLTGHLVFDGTSSVRVLMKHISERPPRPSEMSELDIPPALEDLVMQCLEKDPAARPASATAFARRLREVPLGRGWTEERSERWWATHLPG